MSLVLTESQQRQFDEDGFVLVENALTPDTVDRLVGVVNDLDTRYRKMQNIAPDAAFQVRNALAHHEELFRLIDHPVLFPMVVDAIGPNIQIRTSHMDVRPPCPAEFANQPLGAKDSFFPWHSDGPDFGYPVTNGAVPFVEVKVGYYLTDLSEHNAGAICVVRGSHLMSPKRIHDPEHPIDPARIFEVNVKPGTAMLWRTALWHCLTPNLSVKTRKCLYYGYHHRWIRPADYLHQSPELLARCTPVQLQLLGELNGGAKNYMGDDPVHPISRHWRPREEDLPVKTWYEEQLKLKENGGIR
ncbi:MAG: phytanoyl-CoA dioxygenase family protein [candidate division Zixibacteria bacterium]|nr:phytanoyl-CoA dioxygenase family protein [candidate division Zixibacteria bacterium]